jgi:DNA-binding helix-hairpin-helix protein with protein kinase domain
MVVIGATSGRGYQAGRLVASAGEGSVYEVEGDKRLLLKVFARPLTPWGVDKLRTLAAVSTKPAHAALPVEVVVDPATGTPVGFVQPYFARAVPLTRILDAHGRTSLGLPDDFAFRVKLCRLLAEAFARVHAADLVVGDVSDGNFLLGRDRLGRAWVVYAIDCNSFQVALRTARGNEFYPSGVATEEYAAPEVQPTDWATSPRSVYSDAFGFSVLAWKILFGGSHPFAVVTPRSVDVPPLGQRIEQRLFPYHPGLPLPTGWAAPDVRPSPAVLPVDVRELFFRSFSAADPRDRGTADEWCRVLRAWEWALTPTLPLRLLGAWNRSVADRLAAALSTCKPYLGRAAVLAALLAMTALTTRPELLSPLPPHERTPSELRPFSGSPPSKPNRPRSVDRDLFPEPLWTSSHPAKD